MYRCRKPYFIWTIFFSLEEERKEKERQDGRKPYFIWTIFFSRIKKDMDETNNKIVVNLILYGLYSFHTRSSYLYSYSQ